MSPIDTQKLRRQNERLLEALLEEIRRYLEVVELFRAEAREPRWT
jgi:cytochrome P450